MRFQIECLIAAMAVLGLSAGSMSARANGVANGIDRATGNPCDADFKLSVTVNAVDGIDTWPIGVNLDYKAGRGVASRVQTKDRAEFSAAQCGRWQRGNWEELKKMIADARRPERAKLVCRSIASISYTSGTSGATGRHSGAAVTEKSDLCLGSFATDRVSARFKSFYESTDGMVRE